MPPLLADFIHAGACIPICEKFLTLPKASKIKLFRASEIIPTRRVKSISKLFCIEDLIRRGFI